MATGIVNVGKEGGVMCVGGECIGHDILVPRVLQSCDGLTGRLKPEGKSDTDPYRHEACRSY